MAKELPVERASPRRWSGTLATGSLLGAVGASSCCVLPVALFALGATGPWIGALAALTPYQPYLLGISVIAIALGVLELRRRARIECAGGACVSPRRRLVAKAAFGVAAGLVMLNLVWPRVLPLLFS
jgi:mercuric ion transport protein